MYDKGRLRRWVTYPHSLHSRHRPERPKGPEGPHCFEGLDPSRATERRYEVYERHLCAKNYKWITEHDRSYGKRPVFLKTPAKHISHGQNREVQRHSENVHLRASYTAAPWNRVVSCHRAARGATSFFFLVFQRKMCLAAKKHSHRRE